MITYFASIPSMDFQLGIKGMGNYYCDELSSFFSFHNQFDTLQRQLGVRDIIMKYGLECHGSNIFISDLDGLWKHCCHDNKKCWGHIFLETYIVNLYDITPAKKGNLPRSMKKSNNNNKTNLKIEWNWRSRNKMLLSCHPN